MARRPRFQLVVLFTSIVCSLVSLAALLIHPEGTGSWRTSLNIIAVLLVILATTMIARGSGSREI